MDTTALLKKVRKIEIKTKMLSNTIFQGEYHSSFKGRGMSFSEVREYQYGDDVRNIDWNVTARTNVPHIKVFEEERELTLMLVVDISASNNFGTHSQRKKDTIAEICATLAFAAIQNNDKVGLLLYTDQIELYIPPSKGKKHILRIIRELIEFTPKSNRTNTKKALQYVGNILKRKSIVFVLSDFEELDFEKELGAVAKGHDLTGIKVYDKRVKEMPNVGLLPIENIETGEVRVLDTTSAQVRGAIAANFYKNTVEFKKQFSQHNSGTISCQADQDYALPLIKYFKNR